MEPITFDYRLLGVPFKRMRHGFHSSIPIEGKIRGIKGIYSNNFIFGNIPTSFGYSQIEPSVVKSDGAIRSLTE